MAEPGNTEIIETTGAHSADEVEKIGTFPFKEQPLDEIGRGKEFRVLRHDDGWVIKEGIHPKVNTLEQLKQDKADHDIFKLYLSQFIPETYFIRGHGSDGKPSNIIRQREVVGRPLLEVSDEEIFNNREIRTQLQLFFEQCDKLWDETGRVPDLWGPKDMLKGLNPRYANNISVEDGTNKVWLIDTAAHPLAFSKEAMLRYKPAVFILRKMMGRFKKQLQAHKI